MNRAAAGRIRRGRRKLGSRRGSGVVVKGICWWFGGKESGNWWMVMVQKLGGAESDSPCSCSCCCCCCFALSVFLLLLNPYSLCVLLLLFLHYPVAVVFTSHFTEFLSLKIGEVLSSLILF